MDKSGLEEVAILRKSSKLILNTSGGINALLIPLILVIILLLAIGGFAFWSYDEMQKYKYDTDKIVATQVEIAKKETATLKDNEFSEREKDPLKSYQGPDQFGNVMIKFPKTWSGYVDDSGKGSSPIDGYFQPMVVPNIQSGTSYALRLQVVDRSFSDEVKNYDSQVKSGRVNASMYSNPNIPGIVGMRIEGELTGKQKGIVILMPLRDKTVKLWTESDLYYKDFADYVLPNFSFTP